MPEDHRSRTMALDEALGLLSERRSDITMAQRNFGRGSNGVGGATAMTAASKMKAYREGRQAMTKYNESMREQLLESPDRRRNMANGASAAREVSSSRTTPSEMSSVFASPGESTSETLTRVTKANRVLDARVKTLERENAEYSKDLAALNMAVQGISSESASTDQKVLELADSLQHERVNHERARESLEQKTREVELQAARLAEMERTSNAIHTENMMLSTRIQELNEQAEEQERAITAAATAVDKGNGDDFALPVGLVRGELEPVTGGVSNAEMESLKRDLDRARTTLEYKTRKLEVISDRADQMAEELRRFRGSASRDRLKKFLRGVWWLARAVGFLGFMLFVYLALSEDVLRSRGVGVHRLAH